MSLANPLWGSPLGDGELLKHGWRVQSDVNGQFPDNRENTGNGADSTPTWPAELRVSQPNSMTSDKNSLLTRTRKRGGGDSEGGSRIREVLARTDMRKQSCGAVPPSL